MGQEFDQDMADSHTRPASFVDREEFAANHDAVSQVHDIGDQTGVAFRLPSFGEVSPGLTRDYLGVSPLHYSSNDFNQRLIDNRGDATTNASDRYAVALTYGTSATAQVGLWPYPIIGLGPYYSSSLVVGYTSTGQRFVQTQRSWGIGFGTFFGAGSNQQITFHGKLEQGRSHDSRLELNGGLGSLSGSISSNMSFEVAISASPLLSRSLTVSVGGEGLAIAAVYSTTYTEINPDAKLKQGWDSAVTDIGRKINEIEIQLYRWSNAMEP
ncbi:hypothetical protein DAMDJJ_20525 [Cupriavidus necator]